jgi:hypothetical protein
MHLIATMVQKASGYFHFLEGASCSSMIRGEGRPGLIGTFVPAKGLVRQPGEDIYHQIITSLSSSNFLVKCHVSSEMEI